MSSDCSGTTSGMLEQARRFLKDSVRREIDFSATDQARGLPPPPIEKPRPPEARRVALPMRESWQHVTAVELADAIDRRHSRRRFTTEPVFLDELSFLLWATQGVRKVLRGGTALRTVPSAGRPPCSLPGSLGPAARGGWTGRVHHVPPLRSAKSEPSATYFLNQRTIRFRTTVSTMLNTMQVASGKWRKRVCPGNSPSVS